MEPTKKDKPSAGLFVVMTILYFGLYFGLKYGVFGGELPWYFNVTLIAICLAIVLYLRSRASTDA